MWVRAFCKGAMNIYCHLVYKIDIKGLENIPKEEPVILCSNHVHLLDSISIVIHLKRMIHPMAKEELFNTKFKNWIMREVGCYPVKRGKGDTTAIDDSIKYLNEDKHMLLIFPEGTRNGMEKGLKLKKGAALIALNANVPVIPIGIQGTYKPFSKVRIRIGKPITLEGYTTGAELNPRDIVTLTNVIGEKIVELRDIDE